MRYMEYGPTQQFDANRMIDMQQVTYTNKGLTRNIYYIYRDVEIDIYVCM